MSGWRLAQALAVFTAVAIFLSLTVLAACDRYKHVLTNVERVDEPNDALEVYHDKARGVTCYQSGLAMACVADIQLSQNLK